LQRGRFGGPLTAASKAAVAAGLRARRAVGVTRVSRHFVIIRFKRRVALFQRACASLLSELVIEKPLVRSRDEPLVFHLAFSFPAGPGKEKEEGGLQPFHKFANNSSVSTGASLPVALVDPSFSQYEAVKFLFYISMRIPRARAHTRCARATYKFTIFHAV